MEFSQYKAAGMVTAIVLFSLMLVTGCRSTGAGKGEAPHRVVEDDLGRAVKLPEKIDRAVSLAPSLTEMIFAAGAGDRLVGVTTYCNYPAEALLIQKVGDTQTPNIESIVALKPQVVFVSTASQLQVFTNILERQGIAVFVTNPANFEDVLRNLKKFGEIFGASEKAESVIADLGARARKIAAFVDGKPPVRVFVQISNDPLFTIGKDSFLTATIERVGGVSVTREVGSAYPKLSKETAMALNPEAIILSDSSDNRQPNAVFKNSQAVRNGRVYRVNADIISRPGPRIVDAMEQIADQINDR